MPITPPAARPVESPEEAEAVEFAAVGEEAPLVTCWPVPVLAVPEVAAAEVVEETLVVEFVEDVLAEETPLVVVVANIAVVVSPEVPPRQPSIRSGSL